VSTVRKWLGVLIAVALGGRWAGVEAAAPKAVPSVEELGKAAMARLTVIHSIRVEYEVRWKALRSIPGKTDGMDEGPLEMVFMAKGEKRYLRTFPQKGSRREPDLVVFDGETTGDFRYKFIDRPDPLMMTAYLLDGKEARCDGPELYCREALGLLMSDRERAGAGTTTVFPHCLVNEDAAAVRNTKAAYRFLPSPEAVDGVPCYVLESPSYCRFWIDPAVGYAWRREEIYAGPKYPDRVDDIIVFRHLTTDDLGEVVELELGKVRNRLGEHGLALVLTEEAKKWIVKKGSNLDFGARPLRRAIEHSVEDPLSEDLLKGEFQGKDTITIMVKEVGGKKQLYFEGTVGGSPAEPTPVGVGAGASSDEVSATPPG